MWIPDLRMTELLHILLLRYEGISMTTTRLAEVDLYHDQHDLLIKKTAVPTFLRKPKLHIDFWCHIYLKNKHYYEVVNTPKIVV